MPSSLRYLAVLIGGCTIGAALSLGGVFVEGERSARTTAEALTGGNVADGKVAIDRFGCGACHVIPGVPGATGRVGPSLKGLAARAEIAGVLPNDPASLRRWLRAPQAVVPGNGMPNQPLSDRDARDISAYLYTLKR